MADVIRWTETIFDRRRKGKALRIGERTLAGEVIERTDEGWVRVLLRVAVITKAEFAGKSIPPLKTGDTIKRGLKTILRGQPERLSWTDESARAAVVRKRDQSRFFDRPKHEP
ncbi:MAG: hypothetical protein J0M19_07170 [Sphingomonadales bacterium]|nr:hypothetical protein [Sphingomonadales bacterium]